MISPPLSQEAASRVATAVQLEDVGLIELHSKFLENTSSANGKLSWELDEQVAVWSQDDHVVQAVFPFKVMINVTPEPEGVPAPLAEVVVMLRLQYRLTAPEKIAPEDLPHFVGISGYLHAWPYLRAEVQSLTGKIGLPPLILPVIVSGHPAKTVTVMPFEEAQQPAAASPEGKGTALSPQLPGKQQRQAATTSKKPVGTKKSASRQSR